MEKIVGLKKTKDREQLAILNLDGSVSMTEPDASGVSKAESASEATRNLITRILKSAIKDTIWLSVIKFDDKVEEFLSPRPVEQVDPTLDYNPLKNHGGSTSIGDTLAYSFQVAQAFLQAQAQDPRSVSIIVMSDGCQTSGANNPRVVANAITNSGLKINVHTVAYGMANNMDRTLLEEIATTCGGMFCYTKDPEVLRNFFFKASQSQVA